MDSRFNMQYQDSLYGDLFISNFQIHHILLENSNNGADVSKKAVV